MKPIAYTYDADQHCPDHAAERFGTDEHGNVYGTDTEGNEVHPVFSWEETDDSYCSECVYEEVRNRNR